MSKPSKQNKNKGNLSRKKVRKFSNWDKAQLQPGFLQCFPLRLNTSLSYSDQFKMYGVNNSDTFGTEQTYRLASLYDPDFTNAGHQPFGFDQLIPWYVRYQVKSATVKITFSDPSSDGMYVAMMVKNLNDPATLVNSTIPQARERPNVILKPLNNTGSQKTTLTKHIDFAGYSGLTKQQWINDWSNTSALTNANPTFTPYFMIAVADGKQAASAGSVLVTVEIIFHATFMERITPGQS